MRQEVEQSSVIHIGATSELYVFEQLTTFDTTPRETNASVHKHCTLHWQRHGIYSWYDSRVNLHAVQVIVYSDGWQQTANYELLAGEEPVDTEENSAFKSLLESRRGVVLKTPHGGSLSIHAEGDSYSYCYGPRGFTGLLRNRYAAGCALFASIGGLSFGYDQGVIANVLVMRDFLARWPVGPWEKGLMSMFLPAQSSHIR